MQSLPSIYLST